MEHAPHLLAAWRVSWALQHVHLQAGRAGCIALLIPCKQTRCSMLFDAYPQVSELKDSTRYERTLALLQKYDPGASLLGPVWPHRSPNSTMHSRPPCPWSGHLGCHVGVAVRPTCPPPCAPRSAAWSARLHCRLRANPPAAPAQRPPARPAGGARQQRRGQPCGRGSSECGGHGAAGCWSQDVPYSGPAVQPGSWQPHR